MPLRYALLVMCTLLRASATCAAHTRAAKTVAPVKSLSLRAAALYLSLALLLALPLALLHAGTPPRRADPDILRVRLVGRLRRATCVGHLRPSCATALPAEAHKSLRTAAIQLLCIIPAALSEP